MGKLVIGASENEEKDTYTTWLISSCSVRLLDCIQIVKYLLFNIKTLQILTMVTIVSLAIYSTCLTLAMPRNAIIRKASKVLIIL